MSEMIINYLQLKKRSFLIVCLSLMLLSCRKEHGNSRHYFEVGFTQATADWRDSSFVIATSDAVLIDEVNAQLALPVIQRKIIVGTVVSGNGGYNRNEGHAFTWRIKEDDWSLADVSIEIYDGRPYSDLDWHRNYWIDTIKRFGPWSSYIRREVTVPE